MNNMTGFYRAPTCWSSASIDLDGPADAKIILPAGSVVAGLKDNDRVVVTLKNENNIVKWDVNLQ